jgi:HEPN domain-containing protein
LASRGCQRTEDTDIPDDALGFHAQQAVEKMIKAVLAWHEVPYERTHNLAYLVTLLEEARRRGGGAQCEELPALTPWAAVFRYDDLPEVGFNRRETVSVVEKVKAGLTLSSRRSGTQFRARAGLLRRGDVTSKASGLPLSSP